MMIPSVFKNNIGLPWCFYYLGVAEYLLHEAHKQCEKNECLWNIEEKIQEIQVYINTAIELYAIETKTQGQMKGFCQKKQIVKANVDKIKVKFAKKKQQSHVG